MLVLSMNSKRQRRPNVRLREIGDVSAAFACGFSQRTHENLGHKRWKHDFVNPSATDPRSVFEFSKQKSPEFTVIEPGVSPRIAADFHQNRENKNPNSSKLAFEHVNLDKTDIIKSSVNFGTVTRKSRVMKRRSRNTRGKNNAFGGAWNSKLSPEFSSEDGKEDGEKGYVGFASNICDGYYLENGIKDFSDHETPATSKEACEFDENENDGCQPGNCSDFWKEDTFYEGNDVFIKNGDVYTVRRWLEELGFGKYAGVFEMHKVDEETLPLLTFEDLKEMGVFAVGLRRKLYNAIQQLRGEVVST